MRECGDEVGGEALNGGNWVRLGLFFVLRVAYRPARGLGGVLRWGNWV